MTRNEFIMLMKVHAHLIGCGPLENYRGKLTVRKRLAMVTGVAPAIAQEAIRLYSAGEEPKEKAVVRQKKTLDPELAGKIREIVVNANKSGVPMHSKLLKAELAKQGR